MKLKIAITKKLIVALLFVQTFSFAQVEPTTAIISMYTCKGTEIELDLGICPPSGSKVSWKSEAGREISTSVKVIVKPSKTTSYLFQCTHTEGTITTIIKKIVKVVVIETVKIKVEDNLTECMEGRNLAFTGEIVGDIPADLTIKYIFTWGTIDKKEIPSASKIVNATIKAPVIALTDVDHEDMMKVNLQIKIGDKNICSPAEIKIKVIQLWINYFRDAAPAVSGSSKDWKIVIGKPVEFSVKATSDCKCDWDISGPTKTWALKNATSTALLNNTLKIDYSSIYGFSGGILGFSGKNDWLGTSNGQVKVTCTDAKGNTRTRLLKDQVVSNPPSVKIFFDMYLTFTGAIPSHKN